MRYRDYLCMTLLTGMTLLGCSDEPQRQLEVVASLDEDFLRRGEGSGKIRDFLPGSHGRVSAAACEAGSSE